MAKPIVSIDLMSRLKNAALNGSVIAKDIIVELDKEIDEVFDGKMNYFASKRYVSTRNFGDTGDVEYEYRTIRVVVTYCSKDLENPNFPDKGNPMAPHYERNRCETSPANFADMFKNLRGHYNDEEIKFFDSAMRYNGEVILRIGTTMSDFAHAYSFRNYIDMAQDGDSSLHKSCMRHDSVFEITADFYANFCKTKILIAETKSGEVIGRAILWDNVYFGEQNDFTSFIDRCYFSFDFVYRMMLNFARDNGYDACKAANTYDSYRAFRALRDGDSIEEGDKFYSYVSYTFDIPKWFRGGAPYCDTLLSLRYDVGGGKFEMFNDEEDVCNARFRHSSGYASRYEFICPICGCSHENYNGYGNFCCDDCTCDFGKDILNNTYYKNGYRKCGDLWLPADMVTEDGEKSLNYLAAEMLQKLTS